MLSARRALLFPKLNSYRARGPLTIPTQTSAVPHLQWRLPNRRLASSDTGSASTSTSTSTLATEATKTKTTNGTEYQSHGKAQRQKTSKWSILLKIFLYMSALFGVGVVLTALLVYRWYVGHKRNIDKMLDSDQELKTLIAQVKDTHALYENGESPSFAHEFSLLWNAPLRTIYTLAIVGLVMLDYGQFFKSHDSSKSASWSDEQLQQYREALSIVHERSAERILKLCQHNRGGFVKLGQYVASLQYAVPKEYTEQLKKLQDQAPFHPLGDTLALFQQQFDGTSLSDLFETFDNVPIASASIAQVHRATVFDAEQGKSVPVAVKVQHPGLLQNFDTDLFIMKVILVMTNRFFDFRLSWVLPEFHKLLYSELDFINEGANCQRLGDILRHNKKIVVPKIFWDRTTAKVLTMEWMEGVKLTDPRAYQTMGMTEKEVATLLTESYGQQTFENGFLHGDPHEGNLLVRYNPEVGGAQLVFLDHGCYKELDEATRLNYAGLWRAIVTRDNEKLRLHTRQFGIDEKYAQLLAFVMTFSAFVFSDDRQGLLDQRMRSSGKEWKNMGRQLKEQFQLSRQFIDIFDLVQEMFENVDPAFLLLSRSNTLVRGLVLSLGRPINSFEVYARYATKGSEMDQYLMPYEQQLSMNKGHKTIFFNRAHVRSFWSRVSMWFRLLHLRFQVLMLNMRIWFFTRTQRFLEWNSTTPAAEEDMLEKGSEMKVHAQ